MRTGQRGPGRVKRGSRIACVGLGRSGTSVGPPAGRGAGCAAAGECGRTLVTGWGCRGGRREYAGDVGRVLVDCQPTCPQGLIPSRILPAALPDSLQAATIAVAAGHQPAGCRGRGSRNRRDCRGKKEPAPPAFGGPRLNLSPSHRVTDLQTPHPLGAPLLGPLSINCV